MTRVCVSAFARRWEGDDNNLINLHIVVLDRLNPFKPLILAPRGDLTLQGPNSPPSTPAGPL